ncbi:hypothetical protein [Streptomyces sp. SID3212]|uniref:hypothetical protein n=1 Tax=Streptomyces sp. SID3212 TaxID=2690259 RepID=UPI00136AF2E2|nr:hypothetical protein [Streptomyces sp. SID3212]MYV56500.1 hypothetical protein [Streptomyces sp. SID3212]
MPIAIVRSETYYLPPPRLPRDAWVGIPLAERVFVWMGYRLNLRLTPPEGDVDHVAFARIDSNRWLVECVCGAAQVTSPVDPRSACTQCGYGWCAMVVPTPEEVEAIEAELLAIPQPHLRFWWHPDDPANPATPPDPEPADPPAEDEEPQ